MTRWIKTGLVLLWCVLASSNGLAGKTGQAKTVSSGDAYVSSTGTSWKMGSSKVKKTVAFSKGRFFGVTWTDKISGNTLIPQEVQTEEFFLMLGSNENRISSIGEGWNLMDTKTRKLSDKTLELKVVLQRETLMVRKFYIIHPGSSIIREWCEIANAGDEPIRVINPGFLSFSAQMGNPATLDFNWMTGAENQSGSWMLKTERLQAGSSREFDSYDAFPTSAEIKQFAGDGVKLKVMLNDRKLWPEKDWMHIANAESQVAYDISADVVAGDRLVFIVNAKNDDGWDSTTLDPVITTEDGVRHQASAGLSESQGGNQWGYEWEQNGTFKEMVFNPALSQWQREDDRGTDRPLIRSAIVHPDFAANAVRVWTADKPGTIHITGVVSNPGNGIILGNGTGFKLGSSAYAPWYSLLQPEGGQGVFMGWDYLGHWHSTFTINETGHVQGHLSLAAYDSLLQKGESIRTPAAFTGLFQNDLDHAGNECLDWQYQYLWDYTRDDWFAKVKVLGDWAGGTAWGLPSTPWTGGDADFRSVFLKIFRVADLMRQIGGDIYHRDWGWWDRAGDWNGPDFLSTNIYLRKSGIGQLLYAFFYTVDPKSRVAVEHPDWVLNNNTLDLSRPEVVAFILSQQDDFIKRWGNFEWRNDSNPLSPRYVDDTPMLAQDQGFRDIIRSFLDKNPKASFQAVNSGGNAAGYDYVRYCSVLQFSDGAVGNIRNYYASLLFPPDKLQDIPDHHLIKDFKKAVWHGLLCSNFSVAGVSSDPAQLKGARELIEIYHYLHQQGVVGRWVHVFRPEVTGDDPKLYFQRMSRDALRGIIIPKHQASQPVLIKPKGLLSDTEYTVSLHEAGTMEVRAGRDLMTNGISIEAMQEGELVYLNLPSHPGSKLDSTAPLAPVSAQKKPADNMGFSGIEITWKPGKDEHWISYYELFRNGEPLNLTSKGTYYFDHSAGADIAARYEIRTVDGDGNASPLQAANWRVSGRKGNTMKILDDADNSRVAFHGSWTPQTGQPPPVHLGTMTSSAQAGNAVELSFKGSEVRWYSKLGADGGIAHIQIDEMPVEIVDTYAADEITGVCLFQKSLQPGPHKIRITVSGERSRFSSGDAVFVDGFQIKAP